MYLPADEYLSGNVREKLRTARVAADQNPMYRINVEALEQVQPKDLTAAEITVRLGVTWIEPKIIKQFADELFQATYSEWKVEISYNEYLNSWYVSNKSLGNDNIRVTTTYGTKRINGYHILENALNEKQRQSNFGQADGSYESPLEKEADCAFRCACP